MAIELNAGRTRLFRQLVGRGKSSTRVVFGPQTYTLPEPEGSGSAVFNPQTRTLFELRKASFLFHANFNIN